MPRGRRRKKRVNSSVKIENKKQKIRGRPRKKSNPDLEQKVETGKKRAERKKLRKLGKRQEQFIKELLNIVDRIKQKASTSQLAFNLPKFINTTVYTEKAKIFKAKDWDLIRFEILESWLLIDNSAKKAYYEFSKGVAVSDIDEIKDVISLIKNHPKFIVEEEKSIVDLIKRFTSVEEEN